MNRFRYSVHNLIGHPLMEVAHLLGQRRAARWIHRATLPPDARGAGRLWMEIEAGEYFGDPEWPESYLSADELDTVRFIHEQRIKRRRRKGRE